VLFGNHDRFLRMVRDAFQVQVVARDRMLRLDGHDELVQQAAGVLSSLLDTVRQHGRLEVRDVESAIEAAKRGFVPTVEDSVGVYFEGHVVKAKTPGQRRYIAAINSNDLVFCIGPAGTGKTYLAVALAVSALKKQQLHKIILARPAVEAGERLGYLPGDIEDKVNPYLRPLYDALLDMIGFAQLRKYLETELIEIVPLAYMRGRTLDDAFIILDEAQNCTVKQMKTFLTRIGVKSRIVVTGDITQVDLPEGEMSGLIDVQHRLRRIRGVAFVYLTDEDIVRHRLVRDIVAAYDRKKGPRPGGPADSSDSIPDPSEGDEP